MATSPRRFGYRYRPPKSTSCADHLSDFLERRLGVAADGIGDQLVVVWMSSANAPCRSDQFRSGRPFLDDAEYGILVVWDLGRHMRQPESVQLIMDAAANVDLEALGPVGVADLPHGDGQDVLVSMYLGFLEAEALEMEAAARDVAVRDPRISSVLASDPSKGAAELLLDIPADDADDAVKQAKAIYADLRARAGLPPAEPLYGFLGPTGYFPTVPLPLGSPRHVEIAQRARQLFEKGSYDYAVVAAQTACEVMAFDAINELLTAGSGAVTSLFASRWFAKNNKTPSLNEDRLRDLWNALAEDEIQGTEWWASYKDHLGRRHGIVHRGAVPTEA